MTGSPVRSARPTVSASVYVVSSFSIASRSRASSLRRSRFWAKRLQGRLLVAVGAADVERHGPGRVHPLEDLGLEVELVDRVLDDVGARAVEDRVLAGVARDPEPLGLDEPADLAELPVERLGPVERELRERPERDEVGRDAEKAEVAGHVPPERREHVVEVLDDDGDDGLGAEVGQPDRPALGPERLVDAGVAEVAEAHGRGGDLGAVWPAPNAVPAGRCRRSLRRGFPEPSRLGKPPRPAGRCSSPPPPPRRAQPPDRARRRDRPVGRVAPRRAAAPERRVRRRAAAAARPASRNAAVAAPGPPRPRPGAGRPAPPRRATRADGVGGGPRGRGGR